MTTEHTRAALTWMSHGLCATARPDLPWLSDGHLITEDDANTMEDVCRHCPVLSACTSHAAVTMVTGGYWAGMHREDNPVLPLRRSA